ncbi:putative Histidine kinase [Candidatus Terasakiella magnetica]|nr:putative Histidine kinase [Candidatus Terasakiella magnetica]
MTRWFRGTGRHIFPSLFLAPIVVFSAIIFLSDYHEEVRRSEDLGQAVARAADEAIGGALRSVDLLLQVVADHAVLNGLDSDAALAQALELQVRSMPDIDLLLIADDKGRRRVASRTDDLFPDVSKTAFFKVQKTIHHSRQVVIDGPMREGDGMRIVVSRPIIDENGEFLGIVAAVLRPRFFSNPLAQIAPSKVATATLFNTNGVVLARTPDEDSWLGRSFAEIGLFRKQIKDGRVGIWRSHGAGDGVDQVLAWRVDDKYPLVVTAGIAQAEVLAMWWSAIIPKLVLEGLLLLLVAYAALLLRRRELSLEHTARDLGILNAELENRVAERTRTLADEVGERRRMEAALFEAKEAAEAASHAKSRFLAVASHDLRQPVQALNLYANVLAGRDLGPEEAAIVERVRRSALSVATLLDSLLDISKLDAGVVNPQVRPVPLGVILDNLWQDYCPGAEAAGVSLSVVAGGQWVTTDPSLLERILQNLVSNAIRYTPAGGKVLVGCRRRGQRLALQVWDSGIGIPANKQAEIFEEFTQLPQRGQDRSQGLGLGLAIVRRLSELLHHPMEVRSVPGKGSVFQVTLPRAPACEAPCAPASFTGLVQPGDRVLVVEDVAEVRDGLVLQLEDWGLTALAAADEETALAIGASQTLDGIIADFRLHGATTGIILARRLLACGGRVIPVVLLTGDTEPERLREAMDSGFHLLHKPVNPDILRRTLLGD